MVQESIYELRLDAFINRFRNSLIDAAGGGRHDTFVPDSDDSAAYTPQGCVDLAHRGPIFLADVFAIGRMLQGIYNNEHRCSPCGRDIVSEYCRYCDESC